jgi:hypothetical protein
MAKKREPIDDLIDAHVWMRRQAETKTDPGSSNGNGNPLLFSICCSDGLLYTATPEQRFAKAWDFNLKD